MSSYWFKPKSHGYGAAPVDWRGWALIVGFVLLGQVIIAPFVLVPALYGRVPTVAGLVGSLLVLAVVTVLFLRIVRQKTDGEWRWRWGDSDQR